MFRRLIPRARELDELKADGLLAAAFAVAAVVESFLVKSGGHSRTLTAVAAAAMMIPIAWRRRNTLGAFFGFWAISAAAIPLNTGVWSNLTTPFVAVLLFAYTTGRYAAGRRLWLLVAFAALGAVLGGIRKPSDALWAVVFVGGPALAGRALRSRSLLQQEMREKTRRLVVERESRAERAVEDERARIASELQAVVANGVSAMVVQAEAVPRLFATGQRGVATQSLAVIEETGRDALVEMRRLLGVLRRNAEGPALAPQPTLAHADALVARMKTRGLDAAIEVKGTPVLLSPGVDLAGYRVLQEALSLASRADGVSRAEVSIVYGDDSVLVKVGDDRKGPDDPDPEILRALRERLGLYGGVLRTVHNRDHGGFELEARLPAGGPR